MKLSEAIRLFRESGIESAEYDAREILARNKDFFVTLFKPEPTYLGDEISLEGDGNVTND